MRDIAARMDVSTGALYNYFKSKDEIMAELREMSLKKRAVLFERESAEMTAGEALRKLLDEFTVSYAKEESIEYAKANMSIAVEAMREEGLGADVAELYEDSATKLQTLAERAVAEGEFPRDVDPAVFARFILALTAGLQIQMVLFRGLDFPEYVRAVNKMVLKILELDEGQETDSDGEKRT